MTGNKSSLDHGRRVSNRHESYGWPLGFSLFFICSLLINRLTCRSDFRVETRPITTGVLPGSCEVAREYISTFEFKARICRANQPA